MTGTAETKLYITITTMLARASTVTSTDKDAGLTMTTQRSWRRALGKVRHDVCCDRLCQIDKMRFSFALCMCALLSCCPLVQASCLKARQAWIRPPLHPAWCRTGVQSQSWYEVDANVHQLTLHACAYAGLGHGRNHATISNYWRFWHNPSRHGAKHVYPLKTARTVRGCMHALYWMCGHNPPQEGHAEEEAAPVSHGTQQAFLGTIPILVRDNSCLTSCVVSHTVEAFVMSYTSFLPQDWGMVAVLRRQVAQGGFGAIHIGPAMAPAAATPSRPHSRYVSVWCCKLCCLTMLAQQEGAAAGLIEEAGVSAALELAVGQHPHLLLVAGLLPPTHDPVPAPACALVMRDMAGGDARACWQRYVPLLAVRLCLPVLLTINQLAMCPSLTRRSHHRLCNALQTSALDKLHGLLSMAAAAASALAAMHSAGWVHLDLKTDNLLVGQVDPTGRGHDMRLSRMM